jgi:Zn-dependent peptidase ImmA (M78 family)
LFLPFTPKAQETELTAIEVKTKLRLGPYISVDPFLVLGRIPARLLKREDYDTCPETTLGVLFPDLGDVVSALAYGKSPVSGEWLIRVNEAHDRKRQKASLMEEVVHILLDHPFSIVSPAGVRQTRTFNDVVEDEAFNVGAACIIPYRDLFFAIKNRKERIPEIAGRYAVSTEFVVYRIKRAGLSRVYTKHCGALTAH